MIYQQIIGSIKYVATLLKLVLKLSFTGEFFQIRFQAPLETK